MCFVMRSVALSQITPKKFAPKITKNVIDIKLKQLRPYPHISNIPISHKKFCIKYRNLLSNSTKAVLSTLQYKPILYVIEDLKSFLSSNFFERYLFLSSLYSIIKWLEVNKQVHYFNIWIYDISIFENENIQQNLYAQNLKNETVIEFILSYQTQ
uniref:Uncharacterized protein n=1 Tax=Astrosyne radiata TaxID=1158023 RepID=A0A2U9NT87_9STRA|nr:hypothetical protein ycf88 [Astrosyne radiata]AWT40353.1 hypothetical protein ycf88 [Astrosyne radiata]